MKTAHHLIALCLASVLLPCAVRANAGEYYLYAPRQVESPRIPERPADGVLVERITIRRGDTLSGLSGKFGGRASYYPQILLFNKIRNPNRIYAGKRLLVPVNRKAEGAISAAGAVPSQTRKTFRKPRVKAEQTLFAKAVRLFEKGEYEKAVGKLDKFLAEYPNSPHAADAMLYRAECYAKLSEK